MTEETIFRIMFHTEFVRSNVLVLQREEIDLLWDVKDQMSREFKAEVRFCITCATFLSLWNFTS